MDVIINGERNGIPTDSNPLNRQTDYYQNILLSLGYEAEYLPLAALLKLYHHLPGKWLIASPVHWEASHNDAMLVASGKELDLSDNESHLWFTEIADFLKADDFTPVYYDAQTWLFKVDDKPEITSQTLDTIMHKSLMPVFDTLDSSFFWPRLITELQMYLSAHPLNSKRQGLAINGLWFWGEGDFVLKNSKPLITDDEILLEHAAITGENLSPLTLETRFSKDALVIIKDPSQLELSNLTEKIKNFTVNWYWTNCSYSSRPAHWWSRIWS
ncbi:MAG: hypothetical protein H0U70_03830 [Tatlockia sp.]|nr:hypothetical protein [Tatlockia sp.]